MIIVILYHHNSVGMCDNELDRKITILTGKGDDVND